MAFFWRTPATSLRSHADWIGKLDPKNRRQGTSAPTLATAWSGPLEVLGALETSAALAGASLNSFSVEAQSSFDGFRGGKRNHDLVVRATLPNHERVVVCVEAKAGESLGQTIAQQTVTAEKELAKNAQSNALNRVRQLVARYSPHPFTDDRVQELRYQLFTALGGTETEAGEYQASHAVLMLHDFVTDERPDGDLITEHRVDLFRFSTTVCETETPQGQEPPWCVEVAAPVSMTAKLYLAHAVTDLRTKTLEPAD